MVKLSGGNDDEIEAYQNMRSIGSLEACSRIFSINQSERFPSVQQLPIHLPGGQTVLFVEGSEVAAASSEKNTRTPLTGFFAFNKLKPLTRVKYSDFPEFFLWVSEQRKWIERKHKTGTIGRVYTVHPSSGDKYYLRILLHHDFCKGVYCFFISSFFLIGLMEYFFNFQGNSHLMI